MDERERARISWARREGIDHPSLFGSGQQGTHHTDVMAFFHFGDNLAGWNGCRTIVEYDLTKRNVGDYNEILTPHPRWICRLPVEENGKCYRHHFGDDEASIKKAETRRKRQQNAAKARASKKEREGDLTLRNAELHQELSRAN